MSNLLISSGSLLILISFSNLNNSRVGISPGMISSKGNTERKSKTKVPKKM
jgi:hypothetical protein